MNLCDRANAFADGMLEEAEATEFRLHLADCASCQEEVEAALVLSYMDDEAQIGSLRSEALSPVAWWRRIIWIAIPAAAAAAALLVYLGMRDDREAVDREAIAGRLHESLGPTRSIDARFSYPGADRHRPYDVPRDERAGVEDIPPDVIGALEGPGQVAAYALIGATERAAMTLESLPETADSLGDRAALAIAEHEYRDAVRFASEALDLDPDHRPAIWNRAVALSRLGLPLAAAAGFERIAASNEPGWSEEARERAGRLRSGYAEASGRFDRAREAIERLSTEHVVPPADLIESFRGMARVGLYDAARTATSADQLDKLAALAKALDEEFGGRVLSAYIERLRASRSFARPELARRYAALLASRGKKSDPALIADAVAASRPDIAIGALFFAPLGERERALYLRLARASDDPWLELMAQERILRQEVLRGQGLSFVDDALGALERCIEARLEFRCLRLEFWIASAFARGDRAEPARRHAEAGWARARRLGDMIMQRRFISVFANFADLESHRSGAELPIIRAYLEEDIARWPACVNVHHASITIASALIRHGDLGGAEETLEALDDRCPDQKPNLVRLYLDAHLVRGSAKRADQVIAALGAHQEPNSRAYVSHIAGRALSTVDRDRAIGQLQQAIELAGQGAGDFAGDVARGPSFALAAVLAGRAGDFGASLDWLARELGVESPRCAIGIANDVGVVIAARGPSGSAVGTMIDKPPREVLRDGLVPDALVDHLADCPVIDVFARPPFLGRPILPPSVAWRFREPRPASVRASTGDRRLVVSDVEPPGALGLPPLAPGPDVDADVPLRGSSATPGRVLKELESATVVEIHAHGIVGAEGRGNAWLALSPDAAGEFMLTAQAIAGVPMRGAPLVLLSACRGAVTPPHPRRGRSLAAAFLAAGASAVVASPEPIADRDARDFFSAIRRRVAGGQRVAEAVRDERVARAANHWSRQVVVFE